MHFLKLLAAAVSIPLAYASTGLLQFTGDTGDIALGKTINIQYDAPSMDMPVTILLKDKEGLIPTVVATLTTSSTGGSFIWTVPTTLASGSHYCLEITQGQDTCETDEFSIQGILDLPGVPAVSAVPNALNAPKVPKVPSVSGVLDVADDVDVPSVPNVSAVPKVTGIPKVPEVPAASKLLKQAKQQASAVPVSVKPHAVEPPSVPAITPAPMHRIRAPMFNAAAAAGTGMPVPRNTTFVSATLPATTPAAPAPTVVTPSAPPAPGAGSSTSIKLHLSGLVAVVLAAFMA